jgi:hypothetical protein
MNEKELYRQKKQAQLDQWKAEAARLKAKASEASADAQLQLNSRLAALEEKMDEGRVRLAGMMDAGEGAWEVMKEGVDSAWGSLRTAFRDAAAEFKDKKG